MARLAYQPDSAFLRLVQDAYTAEERLRIAYDVVADYASGTFVTASDSMALQQVHRFLATKVVAASDQVRALDKTMHQHGLEVRRG